MALIRVSPAVDRLLRGRSLGGPERVGVRGRERGRERDRQTERERERDRKKERERERERDGGREREKETRQASTESTGNVPRM